MSELIKAVFDTGIVLQAGIYPKGPGVSALRLMDEGRIAVFVSPILRDEYVDVLFRPKIRRKNPFLTDAVAYKLLQRMDDRAQRVTHHFRSLDYPRDPKDEPILNLAIHVRADFLVARDKDLLDLEQSRDFRLLYPFLHIAPPLEFLQAVAAAKQIFPE